nr:oligosaccharide flippase family protein [Aestuariibacter salexigens]
MSIAYVWNFISNVVMQGIGVISTLILVRYLDSDDFGIVAIAMMVNGLFDMLANVGVRRYLILKENPSYEVYCNAWSTNILLRLFVSLIFIFASEGIANYFANDELTVVLWVMAVGQFFSAFKNIGLIRLEKEIDFSVHNKVLIYAKLTSFIATVSVAFIYQNYFALVVGILINIIFSVFFSYLICDFRPKFKFFYDKDLLSISGLYYLRGIIGYSRAQIDTFLIGSNFGKEVTGQFHVAKTFAMMPLGQFLNPAFEPIVSALVKVKNDKTLFSQKAMQALFMIYAIVLPSSFGLYAIRYEFTSVFLGEKWVPISDVLGLMSFLMVPFATMPVILVIFDVYNKTKHSIFLDLLGLFLIILLFLFLMPGSLLSFIEMRLVVGVLVLSVGALYTQYETKFSVLKFIFIIMFFLIPSFSMYLLVSYVYIEGGSDLIVLILKVFVGGASYFMFVTFLYLIDSISTKSTWLRQFTPQKVYDMSRKFKVEL